MSGLVKVYLKPMSVNQCWVGRKTPSPVFQKYRIDMDRLIPEDYEVPTGEELFVFFRFGLSNRGNDLDNGCKPLLDGLQAKLGFNDNKVYMIAMDKDIVKKGKEYFEFCIKPRKDIRIEILDLVTDEVIYNG